MKKVSVQTTLDQSHSLMNEVVIGTAGVLSDAYLVIKLDEILKSRGMSQKDLAQMTGLRLATISEFINGKGISLNKVQLFAIMSALRITSISEIIELRLPADLDKQFKAEEQVWKETKDMPASVKEMYRENVLKASGLD